MDEAEDEADESVGESTHNTVPKVLIVNEIDRYGSYAKALSRLPHYRVITVVRGGDEREDS